MKYAPKVSISVIGESTLTGGRIPEGTDVRFLCRADANPSNVTYRWYINEELVAGDYTTEMVSLPFKFRISIRRAYKCIGPNVGIVCARLINMSLYVERKMSMQFESQRSEMFINDV